MFLVSGTFAHFILLVELHGYMYLITHAFLQRYYIDTARELQRLVGVYKAPIIQHFAESITGSTTIRSFSKENQFVTANSHLMDAYSRPKFYNAGAREWLCFRLDVLSSLTFAFSLIFLINLPPGIIDPGITLILNSFFYCTQWLIKMV
jgi:ABC-type multidrug transport system fused ATPase/permease subunit